MLSVLWMTSSIPPCYFSNRCLYNRAVFWHDVRDSCFGNPPSVPLPLLAANRNGESTNLKIQCSHIYPPWIKNAFYVSKNFCWHIYVCFDVWFVNIIFLVGSNQLEQHVVSSVGGPHWWSLVPLCHYSVHASPHPTARQSARVPLGRNGVSVGQNLARSRIHVQPISSHGRVS